MNPGRAFLPILFRSPAAWASVAVAVVMMLINTSVPVYFRVLLDDVIPTHDGAAFWATMAWAVVAVSVFALLRAVMIFLQSSARDDVEVLLLRRKVERQFDAVEAADWPGLAELEGIQREDLRRVAELLGNEPSQIVAGVLQTALILVALTAAAGPGMLAVVAGVLALKVADLYFAVREGRYYYARSEALAAFQRQEHGFFAAARSLFGLNARQIMAAPLAASLGDCDAGYTALRQVQMQGNALRLVSMEWVYAFAFLVAGYEAYSARISFGVFVFVVTLLLQAQEPLMVVVNAVLAWRRNRVYLVKLGALLLAPARPRPAAVVFAPAAPAPALPARVCLAGASGAGKTTTLEAWMRGWRAGGAAKRLVYVPQTVTLFPADASAYLAAFPDDARRRRVVELLGLGNVVGRGKDATVLSGGEARRLLMARALLAAPDLLVIDEPESGLDAASKLGVIAALREVLADPAVSVVFASHDVSFQALLPALALGGAPRPIAAEKSA